LALSSDEPDVALAVLSVFAADGACLAGAASVASCADEASWLASMGKMDLA
jgi:hypothetical protein